MHVQYLQIMLFSLDRSPTPLPHQASTTSDHPHIIHQACTTCTINTSCTRHLPHVVPLAHHTPGIYYMPNYLHIIHQAPSTRQLLHTKNPYFLRHSIPLPLMYTLLPYISPQFGSITCVKAGKNMVLCCFLVRYVIPPPLTVSLPGSHLHAMMTSCGTLKSTFTIFFLLSSEASHRVRWNVRTKEDR